jgi:hypothetical protein
MSQLSFNQLNKKKSKQNPSPPSLGPAQSFSLLLPAARAPPPSLQPASLSLGPPLQKFASPPHWLPPLSRATDRWGPPVRVIPYLKLATTAAMPPTPSSIFGPPRCPLARSGVGIASPPRPPPLPPLTPRKSAPIQAHVGAPPHRPLPPKSASSQLPFALPSLYKHSLHLPLHFPLHPELATPAGAL